ncbi:DUF2637 domain-containing protein [Mycobacterium heidelbergense]|uniref:DUF2637 domain-containing protein n=1 Tax=Mycobacterium heidelbergense TaxID=53376 RepID=UPI003CE6925D
MIAQDTRRNGAPTSTQVDGELQPVGEPVSRPARSPAESNWSQSRWGWLPQFRCRSGPAALSWTETDEQMRTLHLVRRSRRAAVWMTVGIAAVSFVLSFASLRDLASASAWPGWPLWLWPLIIDGLICVGDAGNCFVGALPRSVLELGVCVGGIGYGGVSQRGRQQFSRVAVDGAFAAVDADGLSWAGVRYWETALSE